jgi:hypothetical protein
MAKSPVGRPPKFAEPAKPVTVTLPERILKKLQLINTDRGLAITKLVDSFLPEDLQHPPLEIVEVCDGQGLIVVSFSEALSRIPGLQLIRISPDRYIISIQSGTAVDSLELALLDLIDHMSVSEITDLVILKKLREMLKKIRRKQGVTKAEILFVAID